MPPVNQLRPDRKLYSLDKAELERRGAEWRQVGERLGLTFEVVQVRYGGLVTWNFPQLTGQYRGRAVRVELVRVKTGHTVRGRDVIARYARVAVPLQQRPPGRLTLSDVRSGVPVGEFDPQARPAEVVTTGDAVFDRAFIARGQPPAFAGRVLADGTVRQTLMGAAGWLSPGLSVLPEQVQFMHIRCLPRAHTRVRPYPVVPDAVTGAFWGARSARDLSRLSAGLGATRAAERPSQPPPRRYRTGR